MIYQTQSLTNSEYRVLPVKNYLVFYVILEDTVEIRRIVYTRVDLDEMLRLPKQEFEIIFAPPNSLRSYDGSCSSMGYCTARQR